MRRWCGGQHADGMSIDHAHTSTLPDRRLPSCMFAHMPIRHVQWARRRHVDCWAGWSQHYLRWWPGAGLSEHCLLRNECWQAMLEGMFKQCDSTNPTTRHARARPARTHSCSPQARHLQAEIHRRWHRCHELAAKAMSLADEVKHRGHLSVRSPQRNAPVGASPVPASGDGVAAGQ